LIPPFPHARIAPVSAPEEEQALAVLAAVRAIDELDAIAGRLAWAVVAHGGSWDDVAASLRLDPAQAEAAYHRVR
jgi:hypothetical protein